MTTMQEIERAAEQRLRAIGQADPPMKPRWVLAAVNPRPEDEELRIGLNDLQRLADAYEVLGELSQDHRKRLFALLGGRRPYVYERNRGRWPDGRFRLVDRGYRPWVGFDMSRDELDALGVPAWHDTKWRTTEYAPGIFMVAGWELDGTQDPEGLRLLSALLRRIANHASERDRQRRGLD